LEACADKKVTVLVNGNQVKDFNDILEFILHDGNANIIGTVLDRNLTGEFAAPANYCNQNLFIAAIMGSNNGNNQVDPADICQDTAVGVPVLFRCLPEMDLVIQPNDSICIGESLDIIMNFPKGVAPFSVTHSAGIEDPVLSGDSFNYTPTSSGTLYFTEVRDQYCSTQLTDSINYFLPDPFQFTPSITELACYNDSNAVVNMSVAGGYGNESYSWKKDSEIMAGETTTSISDLSADNYTFIIRDYLGCTDSTEVNVPNPDPFTIDFLDILNEICFADSSGKITVFSPDGEKFQLDSTIVRPWQDSNVFLDLHFIEGSNKYLISAQNAEGCVVDTLIDVAGLTPIKWMQNPSDTSICPGETVILNGEVSGGNGVFTYFWDDNALPGTPTWSVSPMVSTTYSVYAEDERQCPSTKINFTVNMPGPLDVAISGLTTMCYGQIFELKAETTGGLAPFTYSWTSGFSGTSNDPSWEITALETDQYLLDVVDQCGSLAEASVDVEVSPELIADFSAYPLEGCAPLLVELEGESSGNIQDSVWTFDGQNSFLKTVEEKTFTAPGIHEIRYTIFDTFGCRASLEKTVEVYTRSVAQFTLTPEVAKMSNPQVFVTENSLFTDSLWWNIDSLGYFLSAPPNPLVFPNTEEGKYQVCLYTTNDNNCPDSTCKTIWVKDDYSVYVPNAFTPNADEHNEHFIPIIGTSKEIVRSNFSIFDRWGEEIFSTQTIGQGWDGKIKGTLVKPDVYIWIFQFRVDEEETKLLQGVVNVIR
jgi:gliding motility-associated-like protein